MKFPLFIFCVIFCLPIMGQKTKPSFEGGISFQGVSYYLPTNSWWAAPIVKAKMGYLPNQYTLYSFAVGGSLVKIQENPQISPKIPIWLQVGYLRRLNYDKKDKSGFAVGGVLDLGIGEFVYAHGGSLSGLTPFYNRLLVSLSPQIELWRKVGRKNYLSLIFGAGMGTTFSKIGTTPPQGSIYNNKFFLTLHLGISYNLRLGK